MSKLKGRCGNCGHIPGQDQPRLYRGLCGPCRRDAKDAAAAAEAQARAAVRGQSISGRSALAVRLPGGIDVGAYAYAQLNALAPDGMGYCAGCQLFRSLAGQHGEARRWRGHRCPDCESDANAGYYRENRGRLLANLDAKREPERNAKYERRTAGDNAPRQLDRRQGARDRTAGTQSRRTRRTRVQPVTQGASGGAEGCPINPHFTGECQERWAHRPGRGGASPWSVAAREPVVDETQPVGSPEMRPACGAEPALRRFQDKRALGSFDRTLGPLRALYDMGNWPQTPDLPATGRFHRIR